jgi:hypothetical protein
MADVMCSSTFKELLVMAELIINYKTSVHVPAGWRSVDITARARRISPGMAEVVEVLEIDYKEPRGYMSRTGALRQAYNGLAVAEREIGKRKRLSSCFIFEGDDEDEQQATAT